MPQLDLFSYFSAATTLILGFLFLVFVLHTYFLPKIAAALKFRKKIQQKQQSVIRRQFYVNEMEKILKQQNKQ
jgi:hypothetical protein